MIGPSIHTAVSYNVPASSGGLPMAVASQSNYGIPPSGRGAGGLLVGGRFPGFSPSGGPQGVRTVLTHGSIMKLPTIAANSAKAIMLRLHQGPAGIMTAKPSATSHVSEFAHSTTKRRIIGEQEHCACGCRGALNFNAPVYHPGVMRPISQALGYISSPSIRKKMKGAPNETGTGNVAYGQIVWTGAAYSVNMMANPRSAAVPNTSPIAGTNQKVPVVTMIRRGPAALSAVTGKQVTGTVRV